MIDDLKDYRADDPFQIIDSGDAFVAFVCIVGAAYALYRAGLWG